MKITTINARATKTIVLEVNNVSSLLPNDQQFWHLPLLFSKVVLQSSQKYFGMLIIIPTTNQYFLNWLVNNFLSFYMN
jgi:hypothetical protein